ncbi:VCBS repeat-containing protein [Streptomyces sp. JH14]|uniref:VCBS repeat-containing protein n=1 Tax=Streptomyces sp. JH14 TaxID=2793630 RepID=UPI0023F89866|nr:VCBS repeat-containing protein [Streptomyces sp. JH14]MDF6042928.1 VCBS repeat-containing protein [Streptomyces sp. JH14]
MEPTLSAPARPKRARRIAACTALVLSAGMLLAAPASADATPAPHRTVTERPTSSTGLQPTLTLPKHTARKSKAAAAEDAGGAVVAAKPRADFDDDGYSDLIYRTYDAELLILPSTADQAHAFEIPGKAPDVHKDVIPVGDQTGDGVADVLTLSPYGSLSFHAGMSAAGTGNSTWTGKGWQIYNKVLSPGDLTGDGRSDLLARTPAGELYLYAATGNTAASPFSARVLIGKGWGAYDQLIGANDVTGDGIADLYGRTVSGELYFYTGTGSTAAPFTDPDHVGRGWKIYNQVIGVDDLNGDGRGDLLGRAVNGDVYVYLATGTGGELATRVASGTGMNVASLIAGTGGAPDHGKNDLIGLDSEGTLWAYWSLNNGKLSPRARWSDVGGWKGFKPLVASSLAETTLASLLEVFDGGLYNYTYSDRVHLMSSAWGSYNVTVGPGDLTGDGKGDVLTRDTGGYLYIHPGNGTGSGFGARIKVGGGWNVYNTIIGAGDFTGDGRTDVVARDSAGVLKMYRGTGDKYRPFQSPFPVGGGWNTYTKLAAPGDLTGDGKADLVGVDRNGSLYLYISNGSGQFAAPVRLGGGWNTYSILN